MPYESTSIASITAKFLFGANVCPDRKCDDEPEASKNSSGREKGFPIPAVEALNHHTKAIDKVWAKELYEIRKEDREAILDEMHGVRSRSIPETRERIRWALDGMEKEISSKVLSSSAAASPSATTTLVAGHLEAVENLRSAYVASPEFRIRFLRTEFYDIARAALRYFRCLNYLLSLFGAVALERPLKLSDLSKREISILESGRVQSLLSRDTMGRRIYLVFASNLFSYSMRERFRVETYVIFGVMAEDEETQLHGAVGIVLFDLKGNGLSDININETTTTKRTCEPSGEERRGQRSINATIATAGNESLWAAWGTNEKKVFKRYSGKRFADSKMYGERVLAEPIRWSSIQICMPNERVYRILKAFVLNCIPSNYRALTRVHTGSHLECTYELCQFGIPVRDVPGCISSKGSTIMIKSNSVAKFLKARTAIDAYREEHSKHLGEGCYRSSARDTDAASGDETDTVAPEAPQPPPVQLLPTKDSCMGTDCPGSNCVVVGDRVAYNYPRNVDFREYLQFKEQQYLDISGDIASPPQPITIASAFPFSGTFSFDSTLDAATNNNKAEPLLRLNVEVLDQMIDELFFSQSDMTTAGGDNNAVESSSVPSLTNGRQRKGIKFATYDREARWYRYIDPIRNESDRIELRKRISQTMRDDRKRTIKNNNKISQYQATAFGEGEPPFSRDEPMLSPTAFTQGEKFLGSGRMERGITTSSSINFGVDGGWNSWNSSPGVFDFCTNHVSSARDDEFDLTKRFKTSHNFKKG